MTAAVFAGLPVAGQPGWRHIMVLFVTSGGVMHTAISNSKRPETLARDLRGKLYPCGTWEICGDPNCHLHNDGNDLDCAGYRVGFPAPRPEIIAALWCAAKPPESPA